MKSVKIQNSDFRLLANKVFVDDIWPIKYCQSGPYFILEGHKEDFKKLVETLLDEFSVNGVDNTSEPNAYGRSIENIIDLFAFVYDEE